MRALRANSVVIVAALSVALFAFVAPAEAGAAPQRRVPQIAAASAPTQAISGDGSGRFDPFEQETPDRTGQYSSIGQLGSGGFHIDGLDGGTATFNRAGVETLSGTMHTTPDACGPLPQSTTCLTADLVGTADIAGAHLLIAMYDTLCCHDTRGLSSFRMTGTLTLGRRVGYVMVDANGTSYAFGGFAHLGDAHTAFAIDLVLTPSREGYWIVNAYGQVFAFGDAPALGNADISTFAVDEFVTSMSATPSGNGYWLFTSRGRVVPFGDARFLGDMRAIPLNGGIVGSIATPSGNGYYMVGADGGVFTFGDARFQGSTGALRLTKPVVGLVPTPENSGYWLVASDGGVFAFNARFLGSMGGTHLNQPVRALVGYGNGYLMVATDGGIFDFSSTPFFGSLGGIALPAPILNAAGAS